MPESDHGDTLGQAEPILVSGLHDGGLVIADAVATDATEDRSGVPRKVNADMPHAKERHLRNAPITEAVIDMRVGAKGDFVSHREALREAFKFAFDKVEDQSATEAEDTRGLVFRASSTNEAVQVSGNGFAFSKLRPYTTWEDVRDSARRFWTIYCSIVAVDVVSRLGVRYINRFLVSHGRQLSDYLAVVPSVPETVRPQEVASGLSRLLIHDNASGISARMIQVCNADEAGTEVIIDTDAYKDGDFLPDSGELWQTLEELRRMKNRIFFGSITEAAAKEFGE